MKGLFKSLIRVFLIMAVACSLARGAKVPQSDLLISVRQEFDNGKKQTTLLTELLDRELRRRGYDGRIEFSDLLRAPDDTLNGVLNLRIVRSEWHVQKAFSIPYLLNRYSNCFSLDIHIEIPGRQRDRYADDLHIRKKSSIQAQALSNDLYDPDLLPSQSERFRTEQAAFRQMARKLADIIGDRIK